MSNSFNAAKFGKDLRKAMGEVVAKTMIDVPCPECGHKNKVKGDDIARERTFTCGGCAKQVKILDEGHDFAKFVRGQ